ncbi:MAG: S8 family peptidase [Succinatimonas sp.]|nr:S8 family peptidase [Succinatimonas sp.]
MNDKKPHFWIPDEEVERISKKPTGRTKTRDIVYSEHGAKLSHGLQLVKQAVEDFKEDDSLQNAGLYVFKVELPKGEKIQHKSDIFTKNGMHVNVVKDERHAVVSTSIHQFQILKNRVEAYTANGTNRTQFDYIESIAPYIGTEKNSGELRKKIYIDRPPETVDIQLMFIPNLQPKDYVMAIEKVKEKIHSVRGEIQQDPYYLSDRTPVIRAIVPSGTLSRFENDSAIYRIEETRFFNVGLDNFLVNIPASAQMIDGINLEDLPIVVILDSGINLSSPFDQLVAEHWTAPSSLGGDKKHGTRVASRVLFSQLGNQLAASQRITPRARVIDCNILDGNVPINIMIKRIQEAVDCYHDISKIYNLSANASIPIEGDEMSIIGFELDALQLKYGVQFVISAGNHELWRTETSIDDILNDDDSRIAPPADSMLSIVVGAVVSEDHDGSLSSKNIIAPYSRRGPGLAGFSKPDMCAYGGTISLDETGAHVPIDMTSLVLTQNGTVEPDAGTSFTAPTVAGDLAEILNNTPNNDILLAKALLYHNTKPLWESDEMENEELAFAHNLYGRGIASVEDSKFSSPSRVTFLRTGSLNRQIKERVKIYMPEILAAQVGRNVARVTVTCLSLPPVDRTKGSEYLGAFIRASLKKIHSDGRLLKVNQDYSEGRKKWDVCCQFTKTFSSFNSGDWQIWLELFSRWDKENIDVPYALVATIEDVSDTLDLYSEIQAQNRYQLANALRIKVGI